MGPALCGPDRDSSAEGYGTASSYYPQLPSQQQCRTRPGKQRHECVGVVTAELPALCKPLSSTVLSINSSRAAQEEGQKPKGFSASNHLVYQIPFPLRPAAHLKLCLHSRSSASPDLDPKLQVPGVQILPCLTLLLPVSCPDPTAFFQAKRGRGSRAWHPRLPTYWSNDVHVLYAAPVQNTSYFIPGEWRRDLPHVVIFSW